MVMLRRVMARFLQHARSMLVTARPRSGRALPIDMPPTRLVARAILRGAILVTAIVAAGSGDVLYGMYCLAALGLTTLLATLAKHAEVTSPIAIDVVLLGLLVLDMTLGTMAGLYLSWPWYDKILHFGSSTVIGLLGFLAIYIAHVTGRIRFHRWLDGLAILLVTLGLGAIWEIGEYAVDTAFGRATQGAPGLAALDDTMIDLMLDAMGAVVAAILGPLYMRHSVQSRLRVRAIAEFLARRERLVQERIT